MTDGVGEQKDVRAFVHARKEAATKRSQATVNAKALVGALFPSAKEPKPAAKAKAKAEAKALSDKAVWTAKISAGEWKTLVELDCPLEGDVGVSEGQGLFKCTIAGLVKHFSWTKRGGALATKMALYWLWHNKVKYYGGEIPPHLDLDDAAVEPACQIN